MDEQIEDIGVSDAVEIVDEADDEAAPVIGVRFADLRRRHCRCVVGHDGRFATFCGEPTAPDSSWCPDHYAQFHRKKPTAWEQAATKIKKEK
jgi:hypothetical protein